MGNQPVMYDQNGCSPYHSAADISKKVIIMLVFIAICETIEKRKTALGTHYTQSYPSTEFRPNIHY